MFIAHSPRVDSSRYGFATRDFAAPVPQALLLANETHALGRDNDNGRLQRPRDRSLRAQFAWLLLVVKVICLQNTNWLLSAGIHAAITLC